MTGGAPAGGSPHGHERSSQLSCSGERRSLTEQGAAGPIPDLVNRDFTASEPGGKMVGDITYIPTWQGWLYLATVIDCATRKIVGWAMDDNYRTPLITEAVRMGVQPEAVAL